VRHQSGATAARARKRKADEFWRARKELALIQKWARARQAAPFAVLAEILAEVTCHIPPAVQLPPLIGGNGTLNMLIASTGYSSAGKGAAAGTARAAFAWRGFMGRQRLPLGSGEGLAKAFGYVRYDKETQQHDLVRTDYSVIVEITEIDTYDALSSRMGATLSPQLRQLYSGEPLGFGYADAKKRVIIPAHTYRSCVVAGVQPGRGAVILDDVDGGFAQRWLWLPATDPEAPDTPPNAPGRMTWYPPDSLSRIAADDTEPYVMAVCEKAEDEIRAERLPDLRGQSDGLEGHSRYTRLKVAAALSLLGGSDAVEDEDWALAGYLMEISDATRDTTESLLREKAAAANVARGRREGIRADVAATTANKRATERIGKNVLRGMPDYPAWQSERDIRRNIANRDRDSLDEVLDNLVEIGRLERRKLEGRADRIGVQYRLVPL
jgi:hypothetical protein